MESLKEKTARGLLWGSLSNSIQQLLNVVIGIFLGRLLDENDWGMVGMITIFTAIGACLQEGGFIAALNKRKGATHNDFNAVFWTSLGIGLAFYILMFACAPLISNFYGRCGYVKLYNGTTGSITFIGTVSPAGGNLKEPVTENTKKVARCFYALEQDRADRKRYPAINPIDSYSKYVEYPEFQEYIAKRIEPTWLDKVNELKTRLQRGKEISEQINILGDDGVPVEYHVTFWKAELIDFVILQQDAFDEIDAVTPLERQEEIMNLVIDICHTEFKFEVFNEVMDYFKRMINIGKQMNYAPFKSEKYYDYKEQMLDLLKERAISESVSKLLK